MLGANGRGITEHFNVSVEEVDLIAASLENSIGSTGGFCCGKKYVIDHQRLSGLGYCFSASLPPMLATAAIEALRIIQSNQSILSTLKENCKKMHDGLAQINGVQVVGDPLSPVKHLRLAEINDNRELDMNTLQKIVDKAMGKGIALTLARYLDKEEHQLPPPSIRVSVNCRLTENEINRVVDVLSNACKDVL